MVLVNIICLFYQHKYCCSATLSIVVIQVLIRVYFSYVGHLVLIRSRQYGLCLLSQRIMFVGPGI